MDTFFDSSWYYVRYLDPHNDKAPFDSARVNPWLPVDQYIGGAEHAVLHLLYARFFYKFLCDSGWIAGDDEPFTRLFNQGTVLRNGEKMSKSRGNVVGIDETVERYGVDAMRLFLLQAAPPEDTLEWTDAGIIGRVRFISRVWRACAPLAERANAVPLDRLPEMRGPAQRQLVRALHVALRSGDEETQTRRYHYNVTLARFDELLNALVAIMREPESADDPAVLYVAHALPIVLAPFAPHLAEELWSRMGHERSVHLEPWLTPSAEALAVDEITLVVQINGKVRARIATPPGVDEERAWALVEGDPKVVEQLRGKTVRKRIYVPDKLVNYVVS
jgi:leucyl-tRNA synthetase